MTLLKNQGEGKESNRLILDIELVPIDCDQATCTDLLYFSLPGHSLD